MLTMTRTALGFVLLALLGVALCDEMLSREKRQERHFNNRPGNNYGFGNNNFGNRPRPDRPLNNFGNRPGRPGNNFGNRPGRPGNNFGNRPGRPGSNFGNRPGSNFISGNRPGYNNRPGFNNNNFGSGLSFNSNFGRPGAPVQQVKPPHNPIVGALFGALLNSYSNNNNNNYYGRPTQSPTFIYRPNGVFGRPEYGFISDDTFIHIRNKNKNQGRVAV